MNPVSLEEPFQMQISALDSNSYVGVIGIGRISRGNVKPNDQVVVIDAEGEQKTGKILQVLVMKVWKELKSTKLKQVTLSV